MSGQFAGILMYPNETVRRRLQWHRGQSGVSYLQALRSLLREGGFARLYRGVPLYCLKAGPAAAVQFGTYMGLKDLCTGRAAAAQNGAVGERRAT